MDVMSDMSRRGDQDVFGVSTLLEKQRKRFRAQTAEKAALEQQAGQEHDEKKRVRWHVFTCSGCGNHNSASLTLTREGSVCSCGVVHGMNLVSTHRQKLGALQEDDPTVVGDMKTLPKNDKYDGPPLTTEEARLQRLHRGKTGSSGLGGRRFGNGLGRICDAQVHCDKTASQEIVEREARDGIALMPRDMIKQRNVLKELEEHFKTVNLTSRPIKRLVRMKLDKLYVQSVQHSYRCSNHAVCDARICERHASCIAAVGFHYEMNRLVKLHEINEDANEFEGVDIPLLKEIYSRIKRSSVLQLLVPNAQLVACLQSLTALDAPTFDFMRECQCEPNENNENSMPFNMSFSSSLLTQSAMPPISKLPGSGGPSISNMNRSLSICSNGAESPGPNTQIQLRDAIFAVFAAHKSELQISVRDSAVEFIASPDFNAMQSQDDGDNAISKLDTSQLAFCLLSAINQRRSESFQSVMSLMTLGGGGFNIGLAQRLQLGIELTEECVKKIRSVLEIHSSSNAVATKDGGLFE